MEKAGAIPRNAKDTVLRDYSWSNGWLKSINIDSFLLWILLPEAHGSRKVFRSAQSTAWQKDRWMGPVRLLCWNRRDVLTALSDITHDTAKWHDEHLKAFLGHKNLCPPSVYLSTSVSFLLHSSIWCQLNHNINVWLLISKIKQRSS